MQKETLYRLQRLNQLKLTEAEEAEMLADKIAVINNGKLCGYGDLQQLKIKTGTQRLEDAFLALCGVAL